MIKKLKISDFLNTGMRDFATYDTTISIPNLIDGLKVSQRKAIWTVLNHPKTYTVEQLAALSSSYTRYHHGSTSLETVITGLAQNFTGSNNCNWLTPDGQFGNILSHDASSPRYISTSINSNWRQWFKKEDDIILEFELEDGEITEPKYFIPIVPTILFNGSSGIGTGYSTNIFAYNAKDVVKNVNLILTGKEPEPLIPYYNGFKGKIEKVNGQTIYYGAYEKVNATSLRITQLPIGYDLEKYKEILIKLMETGEIKDFDDHSTEEAWDIIIYANREWIKQHESIIFEKLKLVTKDTENFVVWDENQRIRRFDDPNQLIKHFVGWRVRKFDERRVKMISDYRVELAWLNEKRQFIQYFIDNTDYLVKLPKASLVTELTTQKFVNIDRLLQIRVFNMTKDEIDKLDKEIANTSNKIDELERTTAKQMYLKELKALKA